MLQSCISIFVMILHLYPYYAYANSEAMVTFAFAQSHPGNRFTSCILIVFSLTGKAATLIFISGRGSAISSAKQGKSGSIYNLVKN